MFLCTHAYFSDIDECTSNNTGCDHSCVNTVGSYYCKCINGFELKADGHNCTGNDFFLTILKYVYHACIETINGLKSKMFALIMHVWYV